MTEPEKEKVPSFLGFMTESEIRTPKFRPVPDKAKPDKEDEMYQVRWPPYDNNDVQTRIDNVLGPLSIFAPFSHEDEPEPQILELERPITPIDSEIKAQPSSFDQLSSFVRRRIAARPDVPHMSIDDQKNLAGIIMGEVSIIWPDIRKHIEDPFLSPKGNKELNRRIAVYIVTVCEQLFTHYLNKAQVLNSRGVFSGPANMSRLKAQLALEINKFLNILTIRRYIVADIRGVADGDSSTSEEFFPTHGKPKEGSGGTFSYEGLIQSSRPKSKSKKFRLHTLDHDIKEITTNMPSLDTSKLMDLVADLPNRALSTPSDGGQSMLGRYPDAGSQISAYSQMEASIEKVLLKRSKSDPCLHQGETLLEELDISDRVRSDPLHQYELEVLRRERQLLAKAEVLHKEKPMVGTREYAAADLKRLTSKSDDSHQEVDEDLPPLLQAIIRNSRHDGLKEKMDRKMKQLEEKIKQRKEDEQIAVREPTHPQPATVSKRLTDKMTVRTSDIRVSERVCMSSLTLNRYATVYNDLIDEIDPMTVKALDKNLFLSDEIQEVYREIKKTVPHNHLALDDDPLVVLAAEDISLSGVMASATLAKKHVERIMNPTLRKSQQPPWGELDAKQWAKASMAPPKNMQGQDTLVTSDTGNQHVSMVMPQMCPTLVASAPPLVAEKMVRAYASWLQWWKSTVTSDDYMKFLSTQETDFMGVLFHFYDSEDDYDDDGEDTVDQLRSFGGLRAHGRKQSIADGRRRSQANGRRMSYADSRKKSYADLRKRSHVELRPYGSGLGGANQQTTTASSQSKGAALKAQEKVRELKSLKTEFKEGFWNVNSVMLGGLGKDPVLEEEDAEAKRKSLTPVEVKEPPKTLKQRAALAIEARNVTEKDSKLASGASVRKSETPFSRKSKTPVAPPSTQDRLEQVWTALQMSDSMKLDMAIKYSCNIYYDRLEEAMERWEIATDLILDREQLLEDLEKFERQASDPNRFFEKGSKRSSVVRLDEAKRRSNYYRKIDTLDVEIKNELDYVKEKFHDEIKYKGRPYAEKMKWDRVEMLYWLQEERKQQAIQYESMSRQLPLKHAMLEPIQLQAK